MWDTIQIQFVQHELLTLAVTSVSYFALFEQVTGLKIWFIFLPLHFQRILPQIEMVLSMLFSLVTLKNVPVTFFSLVQTEINNYISSEFKKVLRKVDKHI